MPDYYPLETLALALRNLDPDDVFEIMAVKFRGGGEQLRAVYDLLFDGEGDREGLGNSISILFVAVALLEFSPAEIALFCRQREVVPNFLRDVKLEAEGDDIV